MEPSSPSSHCRAVTPVASRGRQFISPAATLKARCCLQGDILEWGACLLLRLLAGEPGGSFAATYKAATTIEFGVISEVRMGSDAFSKVPKVQI